MSDIMSFVKMAAQQLNAPEESTKQATGGVLDLIKGQVASGDFNELLAKVPGAENLVSASQPTSGGLGGMLGSAVSALGGEKAAGAAGLISAITSSGISAGKAPDFVSLLVDYLKKQAGEALMKKIMGQVPGLSG